MGIAALGQVFSDLEIQATNNLALNNNGCRIRRVVGDVREGRGFLWQGNR